MMNTYTLDPPKPESVAAPTQMPVSASAPVAAPYYMPPNYQYYPHQYPQAPVVSAEIRKIRDWLPWSIINFFLGGILLGLLPLIFSLICRSKKRKNDINGARTMSTLALVFNILITIISIVTAVALLMYLFVYNQQQRITY